MFVASSDNIVKSMAALSVSAEVLKSVTRTIIEVSHEAYEVEYVTSASTHHPQEDILNEC